ncbi:hypothetical protein [Ramlibacter sp.]|uniref:hypothetical protein n=1 Tax=Ramlibacter sp. TaxID=1917967 RepID=UPI003D0A395E
MKLFACTLIIFFGTLMAAALVALGEPGQAEVEFVRVSAQSLAPKAAPPQEPLVVARWLGLR